MVRHKVCPLCSSEKIYLCCRCTDYLISNKVFPLFRCKGCGFLFTQDYPDECHAGEYYNSDEYISHSDTSEGLLNRAYHLARTIMLNRKKRMVRKLTGLTKGTIIDIGSGTGYFAGTMKKGGWDVKGVEISKRARSFSMSRFGIEVIDPGKMTELPDNYTDCITLWHVLEHFYDPFKYISEIMRLLKPSGICIVALPNSDSYDASHYSNYWAAYDVPRHLWHFSPETFSIFTGNTGLTLKKRGSLPLDVFYISVLSEKNRGSKWPFLKGVLKAFLFSSLSIFNKGKRSSVIYVLEKPVPHRQTDQ